MKIMIMGDSHGEFGFIKKITKIHKPDMIIHVGDFGWFPHWKSHNVIPLKDFPVPLYFIDGNHDDQSVLSQLTEETALMPNINYVPRGTIKQLHTGENALFIGGADSIDKAYRKEGIDWWREELITQADMMRIPEDAKNDIVFSHTCPKFLADRLVHMVKGSPNNDPSTIALEQIHSIYKPKRWYFGHWHYPTTYCCELTGTEFFSLNMLPKMDQKRLSKKEFCRSSWTWLDTTLKEFQSHH